MICREKDGDGHREHQRVRKDRDAVEILAELLAMALQLRQQPLCVLLGRDAEVYHLLLLRA